MVARPFIGLSACMMHPDPLRAIFKGKRLLYIEESLAHYVINHGGMAAMISTSTAVGAADLLSRYDGLVLSGGADVAPESYGEKPLNDEWKGDYIRDQYEISLVKHALEIGMPVLGVCRGAQLLNVALGGTLYQDITTQVKGSLVHRNWEIYDENKHEIQILDHTHLGILYKGVHKATVNSVHHQGLKDVAKGLVVEARSTADDVVEAVRLTNHPTYRGYAFGVQWHPEFQNQEGNVTPSAANVIQSAANVIQSAGNVIQSAGNVILSAAKDPNHAHWLDPKPIITEFLQSARIFQAKKG